MVFGTFDGFHAGHLDFFKQARALAAEPYLIVSIARDKNVFKIKKKHPILNEKKRMAVIKKNNLVDKVVMSNLNNYTAHIVKENPKIIALGYDQRAYVQNLKKDLKNKGIFVKIVRLKPYKKEIFKNHLLRGKS